MSGGLSAATNGARPSQEPAAHDRESAGVRFAGYAAVFDRVDQGGDVVRAGAFGQLARKVPLLWEHRAGAVIGTVEMLRQDRRGLRVIGAVSDPRAARLLSQGKVSGLSFGYRVREARGSRPRELTALELVEVSLVAFPMQPAARVHALERAGPDRES